MTSEQINDIFSAMEQYEKQNYGSKCGEGFPELARALMASDRFKHFSEALAAVGLLSTLLIPKDGSTSSRAAKFLYESPMHGMAMQIFYAGYRAGTANTEVRALQELDVLTVKMPEPVPFEAEPVALDAEETRG